MGVRCTVRYVVLPVVLPVVSLASSAERVVAAGVSFGFVLILDLVAAVSIVATLNWLWRHKHPRRWRYLPAELTLLTLIALFLITDARMMHLA
ncbi:MAG TPA: hypothetical protein VEK80_03575 [Kribbellaceae bacterium]|nr:hypothetical protein [Kribbellaceae bacterium]